MRGPGLEIKMASCAKNRLGMTHKSKDIIGFITSEKDVHAQNRSLFATWRPKVLCTVGDMFFSTLEFENLLKWSANPASNKHK